MNFNGSVVFLVWSGNKRCCGSVAINYRITTYYNYWMKIYFSWYTTLQTLHLSKIKVYRINIEFLSNFEIRLVGKQSGQLKESSVRFPDRFISTRCQSVTCPTKCTTFRTVLSFMRNGALLKVSLHSYHKLEEGCSLSNPLAKPLLKRNRSKTPLPSFSLDRNKVEGFSPLRTRMIFTLSSHSSNLQGRGGGTSAVSFVTLGL